MSEIGLFIEARDPLSEEALFLLHEAALEARRLYSDLIDPGAPKPANQPLRPGDIYLIAFSGGSPVGCGALRKLDDSTAEVGRMYVLRQGRRTGIARGILVRLESVGTSSCSSGVAPRTRIAVSRSPSLPRFRSGNSEVVLSPIFWPKSELLFHPP